MPSRRHPLRGRAARRALLPVLAAVLLTPFLATTQAQAAVVNGVTLNRFEAGVLDGINDQRAARGLSRLVAASGTTDVARRWAAHMAFRGAISHNPAIYGDVSSAGSANWHFLAENVGYGAASSPAALVSAYMNSAPHRANILDPRAHYVGVGAADGVVSGYSMAFNTLDFVDSYSSSYGVTREPADAMPYDGGVVSSTRTLASFEQSWDPRLRTLTYGEDLFPYGIGYSGPSSADDSARITVRALSPVTTGTVDLLMRLPLDLRQARALRFTLASVTPSGQPVTVQLLVGNRGSLVPLGSVSTSSASRVVTLSLPAAAKRFNDQIRVRVYGGALGGLLSARTVTVRVYQVDAVV
ncbi:MAG: hypothetical protein QOJ92_798 [Frankiales bacterium]|nr:hypothetical protein [Frankiales bacterium]